MENHPSIFPRAAFKSSSQHFVAHLTRLIAPICCREQVDGEWPFVVVCQAEGRAIKNVRLRQSTHAKNKSPVDLNNVIPAPLYSSITATIIHL